jgi:hypothetical protein
VDLEGTESEGSVSEEDEEEEDEEFSWVVCMFLFSV